MKKMISGILAGLALLLVVQADPAAARERRHVRVGMLNCVLEPTVGFIIGSRQNMTCRFTRDGSKQVYRYTGVASRLGLDIGFTQGGRMVWGVFASTRGFEPGALVGTYVGASADVAFGLGGGANVLVGGTNRSVMLQPLSLSGQTGVNVALGVGGLELRAVP